MQSLENKLKEATEYEKIFAVGAYRTSKYFADKNYKLFFGQKFDENKNWYWFDTSTGKYFVDYSHNLMHIVASSLTLLALLDIESTNGTKITIIPRKFNQKFIKLTISDNPAGKPLCRDNKFLNA